VVTRSRYEESSDRPDAGCSDRRGIGISIAPAAAGGDDGGSWHGDGDHQRREGHAPPGVAPLAFLAIPLFDVLVFAPLVAAGVYFRRRPETHKRLMLLATISLMAAPAARLPTALAAAGPFFYFGVVDLLLLSGVLYDLAMRRKVHPVYIWGGLFPIVSQPLRLMLGGTDVWLSFAGMLVGP